MLPRPQVILTPLGGRTSRPSLQTRPVQGAGAPRGGLSTLNSRPPRLQGAEMLHCVQHDITWHDTLGMTFRGCAIVSGDWGAHTVRGTTPDLYKL